MYIVETIGPFPKVPPTVVEDHVLLYVEPTPHIFGLKHKYHCSIPALNDADTRWYPSHAGAGDYGSREFSSSNQQILKKHFLELRSKKDKLVILEIGVARLTTNLYDHTSTTIFLNEKRDTDIYIGIDINDKSFLDNPAKNIHTIKSPSERVDEILALVKSTYNVDQIDCLMIDGWHSINQCYAEWNYTKILSKDGIVIMHDTNCHPGPYFLVKSIDERVFDVYKYLSDIQDWGISVAVRK
jgi:hypothetical protein